MNCPKEVSKAIGAVNTNETVEASLWEGSLLNRMVLLNYDLKLPPDFKPKARLMVRWRNSCNGMFRNSLRPWQRIIMTR